MVQSQPASIPRAKIRTVKCRRLGAGPLVSPSFEPHWRCWTPWSIGSPAGRVLFGNFLISARAGIAWLAVSVSLSPTSFSGALVSLLIPHSPPFFLALLFHIILFCKHIGNRSLQIQHGEIHSTRSTCLLVPGRGVQGAEMAGRYPKLVSTQADHCCDEHGGARLQSKAHCGA